MGEVIEFAPFTKPAGLELDIIGDDPLITLIRNMMEADYSLPDIAVFLREQAAILDTIAERMELAEADHRPKG
jgi:hypothetical protein